MPPTILEPLVQLARAWRERTRASRRRAAMAGVAVVLVGSLLLARRGTDRARLGAALALGASVVLAVGWRLVDRRRMLRPERVVSGLARPLDHAATERVMRALSLVVADGEAETRDGTSAELARLHVARAMSALPSAAIVERVERDAVRVGTAALVVAICAVGVAFANAWSVIEGADVLVARRGEAPVALQWLNEVEVVARPPEYLHETEVHEVALLPMMLPYGTQVTVRAVPTHPGRHLLLTDGSTEVPFVDDGAGAQVARWPLTKTTRLRAVARFGAVVVQDPEELSVVSLPDLAPVVTLEGAPRTVRLVDQTEDLPIAYEASDDHGLREVELVLRSGTREERRQLARLDGETRTDKGGMTLKLRDGFLRKAHAPITVTVEAKDNDPLTGPKWGASPPLTLVPPDVGEPEARRLDALRALRDALVDTLAWRMSTAPPADATARRAFLDDERARQTADERRLDDTTSARFAGVRLADRLRAMLRAQQQKTRAAVDAEARALSPATHGAVVQATERWVLVVDAVVRGLGVRDSRDAARQLADVADDLAAGATQLDDRTRADARPRGLVRMDAATTVLEGGARSLRRLGALGLDLGEIVEADLLRVRRARDADDAMHAELAARDLAARLREPDPSFGSKGSVGRAGSESGGGHGTPGEDGESSGDEVDRAQQAAEQDLEQLAREHAAEIGKIEQTLDGATSPDELQALREEARRHAQAVRDAVKDLPTVGQGSDSWTSKGAAARELGEQMARSLEEVRPDEATQSGRSALGALDEAKKMLQKRTWLDDGSSEDDRQVDGARRRLETEEKWAEQQLAEMRRRAAERARKDLEQGGRDEEKLAERAGKLGDKSREQGSLPQQAVESLEDADRAARQAADALGQGDAERGLEKQREAQRHLEAARQQLQGDGDESSGTPPPPSDDGSKSAGGDVAIPGKGEHKGPEEFRRRVVQGLGQPGGGGLKDAVRRYAEGLLR